MDPPFPPYEERGFSACYKYVFILNPVKQLFQKLPASFKSAIFLGKMRSQIFHKYGQSKTKALLKKILPLCNRSWFPRCLNHLGRCPREPNGTGSSGNTESIRWKSGCLLSPIHPWSGNCIGKHNFDIYYVSIMV